MAIIRIGYETFTLANTNTGTQNITVPYGTSIALVLLMGHGAAANYFSGGTLNLGDSGMAESPTVTDGDTNAHMVMVWYISSPASGSNHLDWDWSGAGNPDVDPVRLYVVYYSGVTTSSPIRNSGGQQIVGANYTTASLTGLQSGDLSVIFCSTYLAGAGPTISFTTGSEVEENNTGALTHMAFAEHSPTGATTYATTTGGDDGGVSAIVLIPAVPSAALTGTATASITESDIV